MVVTAVLAFVFGHWKGIQERRAQNRTEAYTQLIQAIAGLAQAQKAADAIATLKAQGAFEEARLRLAVYGTAKVARAFARFLVAGGRIQTREQLQAFIAMVREMRSDGYRWHGYLTDDELLRVLLSMGAMPQA